MLLHLSVLHPERCVPPNEIASGYCYLPTRADFSEFSNGWNVVAYNLLILFNGINHSPDDLNLTETINNFNLVDVVEVLLVPVPVEA